MKPKSILTLVLVLGTLQQAHSQNDVTQTCYNFIGTAAQIHAYDKYYATTTDTMYGPSTLQLVTASGYYNGNNQFISDNTYESVQGMYGVDTNYWNSPLIPDIFFWQTTTLPSVRISDVIDLGIYKTQYPEISFNVQGLQFANFTFTASGLYTLTCILARTEGICQIITKTINVISPTSISIFTSTGTNTIIGISTSTGTNTTTGISTNTTTGTTTGISTNTTTGAITSLKIDTVSDEMIYDAGILKSEIEIDWWISNEVGQTIDYFRSYEADLRRYKGLVIVRTRKRTFKYDSQ